MSEQDAQVLAVMDCFHSYYRFCQADCGDRSQPSRYEAWLDYKQSLIRRDGLRCIRCGQSRPLSELDIRPRQERAGSDHLAPDNLISVCTFCDQTPRGILRPRRPSRPA